MNDESRDLLNCFTFFRSYHDAAQLLDDGERLQFYDAIMGYVFDGEVPTLAGQLALAWKLIEPNLKSSIEHHLNGSKGGRPRKDEKKRKG